MLLVIVFFIWPFWCALGHFRERRRFENVHVYEPRAINFFQLTVMLRIGTFVILSAIGVIGESQSQETGASSAPHIILIVADDLGWNDVSFHGSPQIATPNLDALASDGIVLNNHYVLPICTPSRSALLSGLHPIHTGLQHDVIYGSQPYGLPLNITTMPQHLKKLGYRTHAIGKWHLGFFKKSYCPTFRGFDTHFGYWLGHSDYYDHTGMESSYWGLDLRDNMEPVWNASGMYATELFTKRSLDIVKNHNKDKPLFLYLAHQAVHAGIEFNPLEAPPTYSFQFPHIANLRRKQFAGMVSALDESIGQVVNAVSEAKMLDNCVIIVISDNGAAVNGIDGSIGSNWPLRGAKFTLWEGGVRGTALIWSPILKKTRRIATQMMHITDWLPTIYSIAGGNPNDLGKIDGFDMWRSLSTDSASPRKNILHNIDPVTKTWSLRSGQYKLVYGDSGIKKNDWYQPSGRDSASEPLFKILPKLANASQVANTLRQAGRSFTIPDIKWYEIQNITCKAPKTSCAFESKPCLFNIEQDPCEHDNIAEQYPDIVKGLLKMLQDYNATAVPILNKPSDPRANPANFGNVWSPFLDS